MTRVDINNLLQTLTLEEKASLLAGSNFWKTTGLAEHGVPELVLTDGPHGVRKQDGFTDHLGINDSVPATCFPTASATACSFDEDLLFSIGRAIGEECRKEGVSMILGPGLNMKRSPLCGRNFEYFSEDPLLAGRMAAAQIKGVQSVGIGACAKHFVANSQEKGRMVTDSVVDDRALNEIYMRAFEIVVRDAHPVSVMLAYNRLNGVYCCENEWLVRDKLRGSWGFDGMTVADWGAMSDSVASVRAGLDLCMPGPRPDHARAVVDAVNEGRLDAQVVDEACRHVLKFVATSIEWQKTPYTCDTAEHLQLARRAAAESAVLLHNDGTLPLKPDARIAVIGSFAMIPRYQGAGSSKINPIALDDAWNAMEDAELDISYSQGYDPLTNATSPEMLDEAAELAALRDVAVVFAGLPDNFESEGYDRTSMAMPEGHTRLIERVCAANPHTVVVLMGGSPMEMPWRGLPAATLLVYLSGCQGGHAVVDLLTGAVNPSGKLAETWPLELGNASPGSEFPVTTREIHYRESIYIGYRYYDAAHMQVAYPFGHGCSYTTFAYYNMDLDVADGRITASCTVENTGERDGAEVVQVYVHASHAAAYVARRQLAGFAKVRVKAGESVRVSVPLDVHALGYWDTKADCWRVDAGLYEVCVAASSRDVRLEQALIVKAGDVFDLGSGAGELTAGDQPQISNEEREVLAPYYGVRPGGFTDRAFQKMYARQMPEQAPTLPITIDSPMSDMEQTGFGHQALKVVRLLEQRHMRDAGEQMQVMVESMLADMPLRGMLMGGADYQLMDGLLDMLNGNYRSGLRKAVEGNRRMRQRAKEKRRNGGAK